MAKRLTDTEIWDKEWFMALNPKLKCFVKFVRDKCDLAGVWSPNYNLSSIYITEKVTEDELLKIDNGNQFQKLPNGKIFCCGFIDFQNGELKDSSPIHKKILSILNSHCIGYIYPMDRAIVIVKEGVGVKGGTGEKQTPRFENEKELKNSFTWLEFNCRNARIDLNKCNKYLDQFILEQRAAENFEHRELGDLKSHFPKWLKIELEKQKKSEPYTGKDTGIYMGKTK